MKTMSVCYCLLGVSLALLASDKGKPCTMRDAIRAEEEASSLQSWADVYRSWRIFAHCDDGAIAEGYSDSIARLLSEHWDSTDELNRLVSHARGFEAFVLKHIDELMSPAQAEKIRHNADAHCPLRAKRLCKLISARIREGNSPADSRPANRYQLVP